MLLEDAPQTFLQITGAQEGATYDFRVRATDNVGNNGEWPDNPQTSTRVLANASATVLPFQPNILKPTAPITTSFFVNWTSTAGAPVASFEIFYQFNGGNWQLWQTFPGGQRGAQFAFPALGFGDGAYGFEAIAINPAGRREPRTFSAEAILLVDLANAIQPTAYMPAISEQINSVIAGSPESLEE
jgi:hypothetical protein